MRAPRSLLLLIGGTALVVGAVLAFATYSTSPRSLVNGSPLPSSGVPCERPVQGAFASQPTGQWTNWVGRAPCPLQARWRLGGGVVLTLGGVVALVIWTRQSRLGRESADHSVGPPPGGSPP